MRRRKRSIEYLEGAVIAYFWYLYIKLRDSKVRKDRQKAQKGWDNFRKHGIIFVKTHGTETARKLLGNFLTGRKRKEKGPIHYLLQDR